MARLFGTDIPNEKRIEASLPYIFGIGPSTASKILEHAGVNPDIRTGELSEEQLVKIATVIQNEGIMIDLLVHSCEKFSRLPNQIGFDFQAVSQTVLTADFRNPANLIGCLGKVIFNRRPLRVIQ